MRVCEAEKAQDLLSALRYNSKFNNQLQRNVLGQTCLQVHADTVFEDGIHEVNIDTIVVISRCEFSYSRECDLCLARMNSRMVSTTEVYGIRLLRHTFSHLL